MKILIYILLFSCELRLFAVTQEQELFEGDISGARFVTDNLGKRNVVRNLNSLWPEATIPYIISGSFNIGQEEMMEAAILKIQSLSCVRFRRKNGIDKDYVDIVNENRCYADVGRRGGRQTINLGYHCFDNVGTIIHELMHTIGFWHEQSRWDRDKYVKILWGNVRDDAIRNFDKYDWGDIKHFGEPYDYDSIMHYYSNQMAKNLNKPTIISKETPLKFLTAKLSLSEIDIRKLNKLYNCQAYKFTLI